MCRGLWWVKLWGRKPWIAGLPPSYYCIAKAVQSRQPQLSKPVSDTLLVL